MIPSPLKRPTEYAVMLVAAVLAVVVVYVKMPPELPPAIVGLVGPVVTAIVAWRRARAKHEPLSEKEMKALAKRVTDKAPEPVTIVVNEPPDMTASADGKDIDFDAELAYLRGRGKAPPKPKEDS